MVGTAPERFATLDGVVPILHAPPLHDLAARMRGYLEAGTSVLSSILDTETPPLRAFLVSDADLKEAPREGDCPYPPGLPYFTRSTEPPTLVLPEELSAAVQPRTDATLPLTIWHELAHAFLLRRPVVKTPAWLGELIPQTASAAVARREGLSLTSHLGEMDGDSSFRARSLVGSASAEEQMRFQNLLLSLGAAALEEFETGFLGRLVHALWDETEVVGEERAEELLARSLGVGGREWLEARDEF